VVLTPASTTAIIKTSCAPTAVNLVLEENGVIKVQPDVVAALLEHFVKKIFLRRILDSFST
jgi:hypothetical protein